MSALMLWQSIKKKLNYDVNRGIWTQFIGLGSTNSVQPCSFSVVMNTSFLKLIINPHCGGKGLEYYICLCYYKIISKSTQAPGLKLAILRERVRQGKHDSLCTYILIQENSMYRSYLECFWIVYSTWNLANFSGNFNRNAHVWRYDIV